MEIELMWLVAAFGGGAFGAAVGGQNAFIMTGFVYLIGLGGLIGGFDATPFFETIVWGPPFGPHIAFAGAVTAAAYASKKGLMAEGTNGRDITTPLAAFNRSDVFLVGGVTGMVGYVMNLLLAWILPGIRSGNPDLSYGNPIFGATDTVALSIIIMAIATRYLFGSTGLLGKSPLGHLKVGEGKHWVAHQERWTTSATLGLTAGLVSSFATIMLIVNFFDATDGAIVNHAQLIGWALSAVTLLFLSMGLPGPVTHHMTLVASIAALNFTPVLAGSADVAMWGSGALLGGLIIGGIVGALIGLLGELLARLTNSAGDTHIDPPAFAIFIGTTLVWVVRAVVA